MKQQFCTRYLTVTWMALALAALALAPAFAAELRFDRDDIALSSAATFSAGEYRVEDANDNGVLHIKGNNLAFDFQGATLDGSAAGAPPDQFHGQGIVVEDSAGVVIRNLKLRGFKIAIYARNCKDLTIEGCDVSDNWKQHLLSTPSAENGADWLFGHENDDNEWFRYGAGMYLDRCTGFTIRNNAGHRGQNGLCLNRCDGGSVYDNDFSFNSGWGLGMYRANRNQVARNKFDWCIRGYSYGVYNRGQDSAGILVFEQCSDNVFAFNSATHGGDGFFLFAGLETLDESGTGGCNRNLVYGNDFSHASNNGIEATFSDGNRFVNNIMDQADHAVWAGYSYNSQFVGNRISRCNNGISIEHGSGNWIEGNTIEDTATGVNLWSGESSGFAAKPYGKEHHCRSENYTIVHNLFRDGRQDIRLDRTNDVEIRENAFAGAATALSIAGNCRGVRVVQNEIDGAIQRDGADVKFEGNHFSPEAPQGETSVAEPLKIEFAKREKDVAKPEVPGTQVAFLTPGKLRGLQYIFVDEWGPYDFSRVKLAPANPIFWGDGEIRVLGPPMPFRVTGVQGGVQVEPPEGTLPATLKVSAPDRHSREFFFAIDLPSLKQEVPVKGLFLFAEWDVRFYRWPGVGPQKPPADWEAVLRSDVLEERKLPQIDFAWGGSAPSDKVPADHFGTVATTEIELPAGRYQVRTVSDDGVRVSIDDRRVIDNWTWHPPAEDAVEVDLEQGKHKVRIDHFEIDGVAQLQFWIRPLIKNAER